MSSQPPRSHRRLLAPLPADLLSALLWALLLAACSSSANSSATATATGPTGPAVTVTFPPTATAVPPTATPSPFSGTPSFNDSLTGGNAKMWDMLSDPGQASCQLDSSGYHLVIYPSYGVTCFTRVTTFGNFAFQVQLQFTQGSTTDHGGIVFRSSGDQNHLSGFQLIMRADGRYTLATCQTNNCGTVLASGTSSVFHGGLNVSNVLGIVAQGSKLSVYINSQLVQSVSNSSFVSGYLGLDLTPNNGNTQSEVVYTNAEGWTL